MQKIKEEVVLVKKNQFSPLIINKAVKCYYDSRRQNWRENSSVQKDRVEVQAKQRKIRSRRQRLFDRRSKFLKSTKEKEKWKDVSIHMMSEESSGSVCEDNIVVHHPWWRSSALEKFLKKLDERSLNSGSKKYVPKRKTRVDGSHSTLMPPKDAPAWTVSRSWQKEQESEQSSDNDGFSQSNSDNDHEQ